MAEQTLRQSLIMSQGSLLIFVQPPIALPLAIETGMFSLYEWEEGVYKFQHKPKQYKPVREYVKLQGRFAHLTDQHIANLQAFVDNKVKAQGVPIQVAVATPADYDAMNVGEGTGVNQ